MIKNNVQEPGMAKFYSKQFGFLHACVKDGRAWYNMTDVCRTMKITIIEAVRWMEEANCEVREYNVKRSKVTSCNRFVENDGLSTLLIMCCRTSANEYRRWIVSNVLYSMQNPAQTLAIDELDETRLERLTSSQVLEHYKAVARERKVLLTAKDAPGTPIEPIPPIEPLVQPKSIAMPKTKQTPKQVEKPFVPANGHLLIEEWFRQEFPIIEFLGYIDGMIADVSKFCKKLPKKDRWPVQHRINVMTVFRKMLQANEANVRYAPTAARAACMNHSHAI